MAKEAIEGFIECMIARGEEVPDVKPMATKLFKILFLFLRKLWDLSVLKKSIKTS